MATVTQRRTITYVEFTNTSITYTVPANSEAVIEFFQLNAGTGQLVSPGGQVIIPVVVGILVDNQKVGSTNTAQYAPFTIGPGASFSTNPGSLRLRLTTYS